MTTSTWVAVAVLPMRTASSAPTSFAAYANSPEDFAFDMALWVAGV
jgi:hypothetical protein